MTEIPCPWCERPFQPVRRGAHLKRFCRAKCKNDFETAARQYAHAMVEAGLLSIAELKRVQATVSASRATAAAQETASGV